MTRLLLSFGALALAQVLDDPIITAPAHPTEVALFPDDASATGEPCKSTICYDYINTCAIRYGGCYAACAGNARPTYSGAICEGGKFHSSFSKSAIKTQADPCGHKCDFSTDLCGNTFGPGCYTSCPGIEPPSYTIPSCDAGPTPVQTMFVTPVPAAAIVPLFLPLDALSRRQEGSSTALDTASELATISMTEGESDAFPAATDNNGLNGPIATIPDVGTPSPTTKSSHDDDASTTASSTVPVALWTADPISDGGATIGANLATIVPTVYGYLPVADITDSPEDNANSQAPAPTPDPASSVVEGMSASLTTEAPSTSVDGQPPNSTIFSTDSVSSSDVAPGGTAMETESIPASTGILASQQTPPPDDGLPSKEQRQ